MRWRRQAKTNAISTAACRRAPVREPGCDQSRASSARRPRTAARSGLDGPGEYRYLCLDHVREFNARYNFFNGMSADEIHERAAPLMPAGSARRAPSRTTAPTGRRAGPISAIRSTRSARGSASGWQARAQGRQAAVEADRRALQGAGARRRRRPPRAAPALFGTGPQVPPRPQRRRPQQGEGAAGSDRGLHLLKKAAAFA